MSWPYQAVVALDPPGLVVASRTVPTLHVVITKEFSFRGQRERFGNGYNFQTGSNDVTEAFAKSVADALVTLERNLHADTVSFPYRVAGLLGQDAIYAEEVSAPPVGNASYTGSHPEVCVLAQSRVAPKRYLMKYFHTMASSPGGSAEPDALSDAFRLSYDNALLKLTNGTMPGGVIYCRPNGDLATQPFKLDRYARTHQLKRRGRRPT